MCAKLRTVAASKNRDHARNLSLRTIVVTFNRSHVNISRATTSQSFLLLLARATHMMVLFFTHIPFVVNHTINATPPERLQQSHTARPTKDQNGVLHINEEDILGRWRVHFQKFSKLVTITPLNTKMHLREENTITAAEVFLAVKTLKAVRAAG